MNPLRNTAAALACAVALSIPALPASAADAVRPSFEAASELFELVGRIKDGRLTLTLDRWASNEPVNGAKVEVELNGRILIAEAQADGTYALDAAPFATPASYPMTITITAGEEVDLLAADFVIAGENKPSSTIVGGTALAIGAAAMLALIAAAIVVMRRGRKGERA
jgi:hypothetical protein